MNPYGANRGAGSSQFARVMAAAGKGSPHDEEAAGAVEDVAQAAIIFAAAQGLGRDGHGLERAAVEPVAMPRRGLGAHKGGGAPHRGSGRASFPMVAQSRWRRQLRYLGLKENNLHLLRFAGREIAVWTPAVS
jgi:hypothetical protein